MKGYRQVELLTILVNYNGLQDTLECIRSIHESTIHSDILVVENGSRNDEGKEIKRIYPDVITISINENLGFAGGNNVGIRYALSHGYEYICLLNNDTIIAEDLFEELVKYSNEVTVSVPTMYYYSDKKLVWYGGGKIDRWTGKSVHFKMGEESCDIKQESVTFATGCCMMLCRRTFETVGLLSEQYFMYCEDTDFCLNCMKKNITFQLIPSARLWHKVSRSTGGDSSAFCLYYMTRNRLIYIDKYREFFHFTARPFTIVTRYARMLMLWLHSKPEWKAFRKGINDYRIGVTGRVKDLM